MLIKNNTQTYGLFNLLFFKTTTANSALAIICIGLLINFLIGLIPTGNIGYIGQAIWVIIIWGLFAAIPGMFEDVYKRKSHSSDESYLSVIHDLKKSIIYVLLLVVILSVSHIFRDKTKDPVIAKPTEVFGNVPTVIPIHSIEIFDIHDKEDSYAIRYLDDKGNSLFIDNYTKLETRNRILDQILDAKGKIKVEIRFYKTKDVERIEIITKKIIEGV